MTQSETAARGEAVSGKHTLAAWLANRTDEQLIELMRVRPDLTVPIPGSLGVLADRAHQRASILRAADDLDSLGFVVLEALLIAGADRHGVDPSTVVDAIGTRVPAADVTAAMTDLTTRALVWGTDELHVCKACRDIVPWSIGRSFETESIRSAADIEAALATVGAGERALLDRLATTAPIGRTKDAAPGTPADRPVQRLLAAGLLDWLDEQTVELPHAVGQVLRGEPVTDPTRIGPPPLPTRRGTVAEANAAGAGETLELLRHCAAVLEALGDLPAVALRAGGIGVRELRRIAKRTDIDEERLGLVVELLAGAGLLGSGQPDPPAAVDSTDDYWAPTPAADGWLDAPAARRWQALAQAWLELPRRPWVIGLRDANDKPIAALSDEVRSPVAARERHIVLSVLAELNRGASADAADIARLLAWRRPRSAQRFAFVPVDRTITEATTLGIVGRGALTSAGRALLHSGDGEAEMEAALPEPVDHVLVQADLTVIAPGPLTPDLHDAMTLVGELESAGAATVYRISEASVRRALDAGMTAAELHALFTTHSRTPVPQALTYLIDDVARRHGQLRVGVAASFVRCEDPALLAQLLASPAAQFLALRGLAPTVAISHAPMADVLAALRDSGFAPAGEDASGVIVDLRQRGSRVAVRRARPILRGPSAPTDEQLRGLVRELRAGDRAAKASVSGGVKSDGTRASGAATVALLQLAVRVRRSVSIGYVDAAGIATTRIVEPVQVGGGQLDALDPATGTIRHFTLHRISSVALVE